MTVKQLQNDPIKAYSAKVAQAESGGNPNARNPNGSAGGLHQFLSSSFTAISNKYKLGYTAEDRFDPKKSEKVFELFTRDNEAILKPHVGRELNDSDRYMAHFLGAGGASKFFDVYNSNPNASIATVMSPAAINANKGIVFDKTGKLKTVADVYGWASKKMNVTPENITQNFTELETKPFNPNFETSSVSLQELPERPKEEKSAVEAQEELKQKTNEHNFLKDYLESQQQTAYQAPQEQQAIQELPQIDVLAEYANVSSFVDNPIMQQGGQIPVSREGVFASNGKPVVVPAPNISMSGVPYPIAAQSLETGEKKLLLPNMEYLFSNTKNVLEIPLK